MITKNTIERLKKWEYWPSSMFYIPNLPYAFYLAIKARHLAFFSAANPAIKSSGNGTESKYQTIQLIPEKYRPKSILIKSDTNFEIVIQKIDEADIQYPLIAKPDIGFRGLLVKKIDSKDELESYLKNYPIDIIIQEFLNYENECGIFYHRKPGRHLGYISSVTLKRFITVEGNGKSTLRDLILKNSRARIFSSLFEELHLKDLNDIPSQGKQFKLTAIGNHSKGTQFVNGNHLITRKLEQIFDRLSKSIDGWYYGRVDIKYNSFDDLENDTDFKILEINGIIAEPTHIYDAKKYSYFKALKTIRNHWKSLFYISIENHKANKIPYESAKKFIYEMFQLKKYISSIKKLR